MACWWITEAIPIYATALLPLVLFPLLNIGDIGSTAANYADKVVFLFLGGFLVAKSIEKSGLHRRIALTILRTVGPSPKYIVAAFVVVTGFLSAWMSNTATALLMLPIALAVVTQASGTSLSSGNKERFATCLLLCIAYSASNGGMATLIGTPPKAIFSSLAQSIAGIDVTFSQWIFVGMPVSAVMLFVTWLYMVRFGARVTDIPEIAEEKGVIAKQLSKLGAMGRNEKAVVAIFVATALAWVTRGLLWKDALPMVDDSVIAIAAAITLFIVRFPSGKSDPDKDKTDQKDAISDGDSDSGALLDWKTAAKIPWGVLLLIGGGLALAHGFTSTGLDKWIADQMTFLGGMHYIVIILAIVAITVLAGEVISNTAAAALLIPISASLATSLGIPPVMLMVPVAVGASLGFIMPAGTPPNAIVFASGHVTVAKMVRAGLPAVAQGQGQNASDDLAALKAQLLQLKVNPYPPPRERSAQLLVAIVRRMDVSVIDQATIDEIAGLLEDNSDAVRGRMAIALGNIGASAKHTPSKATLKPRPRGRAPRPAA